MKKYTSNAQWPKGTMNGHNNDVSTDTHLDRSTAVAVCAILRKEGFGCQKEIFPIRTWVGTIDK